MPVGLRLYWRPTCGRRRGPVPGRSGLGRQRASGPRSGSRPRFRMPVIASRVLRPVGRTQQRYGLERAAPLRRSGTQGLRGCPARGARGRDRQRNGAVCAWPVTNPPRLPRAPSAWAKRKCLAPTSSRRRFSTAGSSASMADMSSISPAEATTSSSNSTPVTAASPSKLRVVPGREERRRSTTSRTPSGLPAVRSAAASDQRSTSRTRHPT